MRALLFVCMLSGMLFAMNAQQAAKVLGVENRYDQAIQKAKRQKKILVMVVVKEHCRWCEKLVNTTLKEARVQKQLQDFVTVVVDKDAPYPADFKEDFFPSIFYVDYNTEKSIYENVGYIGAKCFLNDLDGVEKTYASLYRDGQ